MKFTTIPELFEIFPLDKQTQDIIVTIMGCKQIGYDALPTKMDTFALRFRSQDQFDIARNLCIDAAKNN